MDWSWILVGVVGAAAWLGWKQMSFVRPGIAREHVKHGAKVIDVRNRGEFHSRHLPSAINIPLDELSQRIAREMPDKEKTLLLHCAGGVRSGMGKRMLRQMGYTSVFNLGSYGRAQRILEVGERKSE
jgi:rhodanese-related sulfurtransferase